MPNRSPSIGLATIIAALITGLLGFLAAKQTLRVEVSLPDSGDETLSIKAASDKIEDLSRKLALAEEEIASLQARASSEAGSEEVEGLSQRTEALEDQLASKNQLIADLRSKRPDAANDGPDSSESTSTSVGRPVQPQEQEKATFHSRKFELEVVSVDPTPEKITLVAEIQARTEEPIDFLLNTYTTFILDAEGNRWGGLTKTDDTLGMVHTNHTQAVELLPATPVRSRFRFEADVLASERPPIPQPPFTLFAEELISKHSIVVRNLEPQ